MASPFNAWGGLPVNTGPGFSTALRQTGYTNEKDILNTLPYLNPIQQVKLDIKLNHNGVDNFPQYKSLLSSDAKWKQKLIDVFKGKDLNPHLIKILINVVKRGIRSHENRMPSQLTGSMDWNKTWVEVYKQWLDKLLKLTKENIG